MGNFHNKRKKNWKNIVKIVKEMPWRTICDNGKVIEVIEYLLDKLYKVCIENMPKRNKGSKRNRIPREVKKLLNRIKMLRREKHKSYTKEKKKDIEDRIFETEEQLIKTKQKKKKNEIGPFKETNELITNGEIIVEKLLLEFFSQFSEKLGEIDENIFQDEKPDDLNDIEITENDIIKATEDLAH